MTVRSLPALISGLVILAIAVPLGGCTADEIVIAGVLGPEDMEADITAMCERMRFGENLARAQPHDPYGEGSYIGDDWRVQTYLPLGPDPHDRDKYVVMASDTVDGQQLVTVTRLSTWKDPALGISSSPIVSGGRFEFMYYTFHRYGDEHSPVVASTFSIGSGKSHTSLVSNHIVMGWVQDERVAEFSIKFSDGRSVTLTVPEHSHFLGLLNRLPLDHIHRPVPVIQEIVARDAGGQVIR